MNAESEFRREVKFIQIETMSSCNLRCSYCPNSRFDRGHIKNAQKMDYNLYKKIIDELSEMEWTGQIFPHFTNEPLLDKRIFDLLKYAKEKLPRTQIVFYTNGTLLNLSKYKKLIEVGVEYFWVTLHVKMGQGLKEIMAYRKSVGSDNIVLDIREVKSFSNWGGLIDLPKIQPKVGPCDLSSKYFIIKCDGSVALCCWDYLTRLKLGNVSNDKLINIWTSPRYQKLRKEISNGVFNLEMCKSCGTMHTMQAKAISFVKKALPTHFINTLRKTKVKLFKYR